MGKIGKKYKMKATRLTLFQRYNSENNELGLVPSFVKQTIAGLYLYLQ